MHTTEALTKEIRCLGIDASRPLMVHSSMKAVGAVQNGADGVLDAFISVMRGGLLIFPTHTSATMFRDDAIFDPDVEPSCVGILSQKFQKRANVVRSLHPTHSVAALGDHATAFIDGEENRITPCPRDGAYGRLYTLDARILFMGCTFSANTLIHGVEEWANIPKRLTPLPHPMKVRMPGGRLHDCAMHGHDILTSGDFWHNYQKLVEPCICTGICMPGCIGDADCLLCDVRPMVDLTLRLLKRNPQLFSTPAPVPRAWYLT
ncbi:MAG: AAC(3) family N-acetyltransferase [Deltaproteobacteria bacterium]|nr:AAC(3) family N-acetyltransferase [Deltaproteobacteria bacterium]